MVFIGILNGVLREMTYKSYVGELSAHQISTLTGVILLGLYIWLILRRWELKSGRQALLVGLMWISLTILFEFGFGHYIMHHPWDKLLHDYNILEGRLWLLVLIWVGAAPYAFYKNEPVQK